MSNALQSEAKQSFVDFARALRRDRDRVRIQMNLAQKEMKDEWEKIEDKWDAFESAMMSAGDETKHAAHDAGEDIKAAYRKLEERLGLS